MTERGQLSNIQRAYLLRPLDPHRVLQAQGQSHLPAFDVEAHLTRAFGFEGWDREIVDLWLISETSQDTLNAQGEVTRTGWTVTYGCKLRLTVRDPNGLTVKVTDGCATGSAKNLPSRGDAHDFAMKNADSYALKRCAKAWGDLFGLSLYNKGSLLPLVRQSAAYAEVTEHDVPTPLTLGNDEKQEEDVVDPESVALAPTPTAFVSTPPDPPETPRSDFSVRMASPKQVGLVGVLTSKAMLTDPERHKFFSTVTGRTVESATTLTADEVRVVIDRLKEWEPRGPAALRNFINGTTPAGADEPPPLDDDGRYGDQPPYDESPF